METKNLDTYIIQETHRDFERILLKEMIMIHHGPDMQPTRRAKGGVAIIHSKRLMEGCKRGGQITKRGGKTIGNTTTAVIFNIFFILSVILLFF